MNKVDLAKMTFEQKDQRLDAILSRLDRSETPMDELEKDATEAAELIRSMQKTLKDTKAALTRVFAKTDAASDSHE